jgi:outer membrane murein-binding lipoprotein Lpp
VRVLGWLIVGLALAGCGSAAQGEKIDELAKKVTTLDKRVKVLEGKSKSGKSKGKASKGKAKSPAAGPKGKVELTGDAKKVLLSNGKRKFTLPGDVPAGDYKILASFDEASEPAETGSAVVAADSTLTISCVGSTKKCSGSAEPLPE